MPKVRRLNIIEILPSSSFKKKGFKEHENTGGNPKEEKHRWSNTNFIRTPGPSVSWKQA